jgi:hypothetical protein
MKLRDALHRLLRDLTRRATEAHDAGDGPLCDRLLRRRLHVSNLLGDRTSREARQIRLWLERGGYTPPNDHF